MKKIACIIPSSLSFTYQINIHVFGVVATYHAKNKQSNQNINTHVTYLMYSCCNELDSAF